LAALAAASGDAIFLRIFPCVNKPHIAASNIRQSITCIQVASAVVSATFLYLKSDIFFLYFLKKQLKFVGACIKIYRLRKLEGDDSG